MGNSALRETRQAISGGWFSSLFTRSRSIPVDP